jgi:IclR family pca regulon transcriptional regulator
MTVPELQQRDYISSLAKGLDVLRAFSRECPTLSTTELARRLNISRASARRFLLTLTNLGYLRQEGQRFQPTTQVLSLSSVFFSSSPLAAIAAPHLDTGTRLMEESCSLGILEHNMVVFIAHSPSHWLLKLEIRTGTRIPAYISAMGRVMLAFLPADELARYLDATELKAFTDRTVTSKTRLRSTLVRVREQRYAVIDQELEQGLRSIAVPVMQNGNVVAALGVASHVSRTTLRRMEREFLPVIRDLAARIGAEVSRL